MTGKSSLQSLNLITFTGSHSLGQQSEHVLWLLIRLKIVRRMRGSLINNWYIQQLDFSVVRAGVSLLNRVKSQGKTIEREEVRVRRYSRSKQTRTPLVGRELEKGMSKTTFYHLSVWCRAYCIFVFQVGHGLVALRTVWWLKDWRWEDDRVSNKGQPTWYNMMWNLQRCGKVKSREHRDGGWWHS